jgi:hypothetical protein
LLINRPSTYFHYILNFLDGILKWNLSLGEDIIENVHEIRILNGILEEADFFKLTELSYKLIKHRERLQCSTPNWVTTILVGVIVFLT